MHLSVKSLIATPLFYAAAVLASQVPDDASIPAHEAAKASNQSLLWGPYKPNLYFGVRPRIPNSFFAGLMWAKVDNYATAQESMHANPGC
jgi:mannosyl-oligosaccharide glucosidase